MEIISKQFKLDDLQANATPRQLVASSPMLKSANPEGTGVKGYSQTLKFIPEDGSKFIVRESVPDDINFFDSIPSKLLLDIGSTTTSISGLLKDNKEKPGNKNYKCDGGKGIGDYAKPGKYIKIEAGHEGLPDGLGKTPSLNFAKFIAAARREQALRNEVTTQDASSARRNGPVTNPYTIKGIRELVTGDEASSISGQVIEYPPFYDYDDN